jgi:hypothetical protein
MRDHRARAEFAVFLPFVALLPKLDSCRYFDCWPIEEAFGLLLQRQQRPCFALQPFIARARLP